MKTFLILIISLSFLNINGQIVLNKTFESKCLPVIDTTSSDRISDFELVNNYIRNPLISNRKDIIIYNEISKKFDEYKSNSNEFLKVVFEDSLTYYFLSENNIFYYVNKSQIIGGGIIHTISNAIKFTDKKGINIHLKNYLLDTYKDYIIMSSGNILNKSWAFSTDNKKIYFGTIEENKSFVIEDSIIHSSNAIGVLYISKDRELYILDDENKLSILNLENKKMTQTFEIETDSNYTVDFNNLNLDFDQNYILVERITLPNNSISLYLIKKDDYSILKINPQQKINSDVKFIPAKPYICWISENGNLCFYNLDSNNYFELINSTFLSSPDSCIIDFCFNSNGTEMSILSCQGNFIKFSLTFNK